MSRNALSVFKNLIIPCKNEAIVWLREVDELEDDYSEKVKINCA